MSIYDEIAPELAPIFKLVKQGKIFLLSVAPGNGPVDEPGEPTETPHELDATARGASFQYVRGGLADASDSQVTFGVNPAIPAPKGNDWLLIDGVRFKIVKIIPKPQAGTPLAYTIIARR